MPLQPFDPQPERDVTRRRDVLGDSQHHGPKHAELQAVYAESRTEGHGAIDHDNAIGSPSTESEWTAMRIRLLRQPEKWREIAESISVGRL